VLPIWRAMGWTLDRAGYSWWAGVLDAVQWGVPQTRKRAILIARRDGLSPLPPEPTHRPYRSGVGQDEGDPNLLPWVSMADALGWSGIVNTRGDRGDKPAGGNDLPTEQPCWSMTGRARSWVVDMRQKPPGGVYGVDNITRPIDASSPTFGTKSGGQWVLRNGSQSKATVRAVDEPCSTLTASADNGDTKWQIGPDRIRLTVEQGLVLQSFPADFALAGTKTAQWRRIGNAVAPRFAAAILAEHLPKACG
jgi:DNA (cytosine-5)-methyltransferase 1